MLGGDERQSDSGRTDTMVVVTVNPKQKSMKMLSIPRDTLTAIPGHKQDKINAAYAYGGVELSVKTVERMLKIPIDYYIKLNMDGFKDLIDAIGGVTVSNDLPFSFGGYHFKKGMVNLNTGDKALAFIRMRKQDPNGDFGREERQRKVIAAVAKKEINLSGLKNLPNILGALGSNVKTNLTLNDLEMIIKDNKSVSKNIQTLHLKGEEKIINGVWYYDIPNDELNSVSDELRSHLDLPERDNQDGNQKNPQGC
nr:LCP family protein [Scopulibacillus daqui]